jgi:UDP-hydrolysing UDP-N-acetyl-D-glucosamine 2-epimerase
MKKKIKVAVIINNRANYARIKSFLQESKKSNKIDLMLILASSSIMEKFGNIEKIIKKDKLKIFKKIYTVVEGDKPVTMAKSTALEINELSNIFDNSRPDLVFAIADRFETLSIAIAASYMNIPLAHTQGGEITGSIDESVRHAVSKLANIHFPANTLARNNLIKMGEDPKKIFNVGCPSIDLAKSVKKIRINLKNFIAKYKFSNLNKINFKTSSNYIIVVQHPVTTEYEQTKSQIRETIKAVSKLKYQVFWLWPNVDSGSDIISKELRTSREKKLLDNVVFVKNCSPEDFLILLNNAKCIVGNSSVGIREASYLGTPCVNIGNRQMGRLKGKNVINTIHNCNKIVHTIRKQYKHGKYKSEFLYGNGHTGKKILNIITKIKLLNTQKNLKFK